MALDAIQQKYIPRDNSFYKHYYHYFLLGVMALIVLMLVTLSIVLYQTMHRPEPQFMATQSNGQQMELSPFDEPNLLPDTLIRWASKAAILAYTFDFYDYANEIQSARPYFTDEGWSSYLGSVNHLFENITTNKLIVTSVVSGTPVISNQGELPDTGYTWRIQMPFLVTYQSASTTSQQNFLVSVTIVRVPTNINPQGIGINQFVMKQQ